MKYLHTMIRVSDPEASIRFFQLLGLKELRRFDNEAGRFTLIFLAAPGDEDAQVELTHNWTRAVTAKAATSAIWLTGSRMSTRPANG